MGTMDISYISTVLALTVPFIMVIVVVGFQVYEKVKCPFLNKVDKNFVSVELCVSSVVLCVQIIS